MIPKLVFLGAKKEASNNLDLIFHIQFQDRKALSLLLENIGSELCSLKGAHTNIKAKATPKDNPRLFPCSVTFRVVGEDLGDLGMWFVNQLSNRVDEFLSAAEVEVDEGKKSILPTFHQPRLIEASVSCPKCQQPVVSEETALTIQNELNWAVKVKEFEAKAAEHQKKNPTHHEKGFTEDNFFKWFDLWLPTQPESTHKVLNTMARAPISNLFRWMDRKVMILALAESLQ